MLRIIGAGMLAVTVLAACGYNRDVDKYQGMTNRQDVEDMGANHKITSQTENPRMIDNVGYTWGLKQDRNMMKEAAEEVKGVSVKRVIIESGTAWVTVSAGKNLSDNEVQQVRKEVQKKVYNAVPRYDIHVKVND
ncbi:hypothetical protein MUN89_05155 [Halobacillus salinarum]|uniref:Uncharacterized protein n=1 Tax=Halobacillus salinarum TaxID=2932257 RepID=A0ABY4ELL2_9BACI|nr:hypothetical protein [Halobacillus salinarum]UOQ45338.1 hypothetical protein MUN89_05155 [Halobacillus salinarum]